MNAQPVEIYPPDEGRRLAAVRRYRILDTPADESIDRITTLAARIFDVRVSTVSIVDQDRIWFKSAHGCDLAEVGREPGFCASAILQEGPYIVEDAASDLRCRENSLVRGSAAVRFYAGAPLRTADGHHLGTLNIMDVEPRRLSDDEAATLEDLAAIVVDELELQLVTSRAVEPETSGEAGLLRETLVAGMSHDLRRPLALLRGITDLVDDAEPESPEEGRLHAMLRRQVHHLDWLVSQFLDFARIENGRRLSVTPRPLDPIELVEEAADVFADRLEVTLEVGGDVPRVHADPDRSLQVLLELLSNALRFAGGDTPVTVAVYRGRDDTVRIAVLDHGPGIGERDQERIFERSFRSGSSRGAGIGLYVARTAAEAQGGRIEVDSSPGRGSCFTLVLPADERA